MSTHFLNSHTQILYELGGLLLILGCVVTLAGSLIARFDRIPLEDAIYFAFIAAFTVGFGDVTPRTRASRMITVLLALIGLILTGISVAVAVRALDIALQFTAI